MPFDAVIFDMDGTLLDTEAMAVGAGLVTAEKMGYAISTAQFEAMIGKDSDATTQELARLGVKPADVARFKSEWGALFRLTADNGIPVKPGVLALLNWLHDQKIPCAVATNSSEKGATLSLGSANLTDWFEAIIGYDMVANPKPAPDVFLHAAECLGARPQNCLAFEDSVLGCKAARTAGMTVVHVPDIVQAASSDAHFRAKTLLEGAEMAGLIPGAAL